MKIKLVIPIIFLVSLVTFQNILFSENIKHKQNDTLVTWSKGIITTEEFEDFALYAVFHNDSSIAQNSKMSLRRRIINDLLNFKIIKHLADSLHVDTLETMRNSYQRKLYKTAYKYLYRDSVIQKIVSNENVNKFNSSMKLEYNVDHILLTVNENNKTNIKKKINSIYSNLIKDPESFNTIAVQNSDDDFSRINGGNLGWSVISNYVPEFSEQISNLEIGEISKPFKTQFGWHIAKLKNIRKNPDLGSFKKEKGNITNQIIKMHKQEFDKTRNKFRSFLYKKYQVYIDTINVMSFVNYFNDLLNEDISSAYDYNNYNTKLTMSILDNDTLFVKDILNFFENKDTNNYTLVSSKYIYDKIFNYHILTIRKLITDELGYTKLPEVRKIAEEGMLLDYKIHFIPNYRGNKNQDTRWFKPYHTLYNVFINYSLIEDTFYYISDTKK